MIRFKLVEMEPDLTKWTSSEWYVALDARGVRQQVLSGIHNMTRKAMRWAEGEDGKRIFGIHADGKEMTDEDETA